MPEDRSLDELNEGVCMFKFMACAVLAINQTPFKDLNEDEQFGMQEAFSVIGAKLDKAKSALEKRLLKSH